MGFEWKKSLMFCFCVEVSSFLGLPAFLVVPAFSCWLLPAAALGAALEFS